MEVWDVQMLLTHGVPDELESCVSLGCQDLREHSPVLSCDMEVHIPVFVVGVLRASECNASDWDFSDSAAQDAPTEDVLDNCDVSRS